MLDDLEYLSRRYTLSPDSALTPGNQDTTLQFGFPDSSTAANADLSSLAVAIESIHVFAESATPSTVSVAKLQWNQANALDSVSARGIRASAADLIVGGEGGSRFLQGVYTIPAAAGQGVLLPRQRVEDLTWTKLLVPSLYFAFATNPEGGFPIMELNITSDVNITTLDYLITFVEIVG